MADIRKIEDELWEAADELRANSKLTSQQYCMPVLGLIFLRYAWGRFRRADAQIDEERARIEGRKPPKAPQDYTAKGAMFIPEEARYDYLLNLPAQADTGRAVNAAMDAIAKLNPSLVGVLPNTYTELGNDLLVSVIRIFNNPALDEEGDDIIGRIYEYFLGKFAPAVASDDGVFFTPKSLVRMITNVIEPERGIMLDPACGSGGMFVSASDYVREHGGHPAQSMMFYGQEKVDYNAKLCLMNMAVHGMQGAIKSGDEANTFYHDAHALEGKCDYVAANPPFNVDKVKWAAAVDAGRLPLGVPKENKKHEVSTSGANYLWINYFYSYLNDHGRAGFVMASSATDSNAERAQRRALVKAGAVDVMLYVGNNFFYTKSLPCTLWFLDKDKPQAIRDKVLFIDAQRYHTAVSTTLNEWTPWQLKNLSAIVWLYRGETQKYRELMSAYRARCGELSGLFSGEAAELLMSVATADDFAPTHQAMLAAIEEQKAAAKTEVEALPKRQQKKRREELAAKTAELEAAATEVGEAVWLTEKFGEGEYADVPGLCKVASKKDIQGEQPADKSSWSLTPGAYVGVPPVEDDGVDFHERMGEIQQELARLQAESNDLMATITRNFWELGL
ncbi:MULTISPECIES: class I SAM-dependent DNA methyltransferase [Collinsella]|uniref:type I restriction-modification system subunit M n=1 Tax=Collinsella TaxID=102106 RepID=UPI000B390270|nr:MULTISPECIES: class I SAM-dependent DNA methyltransferase [Collinsella]MBM6941989.1 N-6 DNA methylase [Collinsella intestinalis]OUO64776.1 N-6 DNA methylase [Collinsella sp. An268]